MLFLYLLLFSSSHFYAQDYLIYISGKDLGRGNLVTFQEDYRKIEKCNQNCEIIIQTYLQEALDAWNISSKKWYKYKIKVSKNLWYENTWVMHREIEISVLDDPEQLKLTYIMRYDSSQDRWFVREPDYYDGTKLRELGRAEEYCTYTALQMYLTRRHFLNAMDKNNSSIVRDKQKNICRSNHTWID